MPGPPRVRGSYENCSVSLQLRAIFSEGRPRAAPQSPLLSFRPRVLLTMKKMTAARRMITVASAPTMTGMCEVTVAAVSSVFRAGWSAAALAVSSCSCRVSWLSCRPAPASPTSAL